MPDETKEAEDVRTKGKGLSDRLDALGWALFLIWVGVALLLDLGWGIGLVGVGIITFAEQLIRKAMNLKVQGFWVVIGFVFLAGGVWELYELEVSLVPILLILAGVALLVSTLRGLSKTGKRV